MSIRMLIADGQEVARAGLRRFVADTEIQVVAEATTGTEAVQLAASCRPDIVLMALQMPEENGLAALKRIKQGSPKLPVVLTAEHDHSAHFAQAHASGASALLLRNVSRDAFLMTIRAVAAGESFWTRTHIRRVTGVAVTPWSDIEIEAPLTPRESEVLRALAEGMSNREIAERLGISYETVKEHVQHILRKIGVEGRTQAAVWAVRKGLV